VIYQNLEDRIPFFSAESEDLHRTQERLEIFSISFSINVAIAALSKTNSIIVKMKKKNTFQI
jgi:hypothetical protein